MERLLPQVPPAGLGLAVSGGSDSTALMHLAAEWAQGRGCALSVLTVDHGLRAAAADEALQVAAQARALGLPHQTIRWEGWSGQGNLQDAARRARHAIIAKWRGEIGHILLGHTQDDQAETVLMHLLRGSGVDGLAGMAPLRRISPQGGETAAGAPGGADQGFTLIRPLLNTPRAELRAYLGARGIAWSDDPSNEDEAYDRVRARKAIAGGEGGLDPRVLAQTARRMARAAQALRRMSHRAAEAHARAEQGDIVFSPEVFGLDDELQLRLLAGALSWVSSAQYRPREAALIGAIRAAAEGRDASLHGCLILARRGGLRVTREYAAVADLRAPAGALWDDRWHLACEAQGAEVRATGEEGLAQIELPKERPPRQAILSQPAIWRDNRVISAPLVGWGAKCTVELRPRRGDFAQSLLGD
ncbi:tRNA lysidine(34) synthetase TilS [Alphaproteobacteria bacterium KMM 3653]|uniref:tRNA(Ile)-lysidine synthase n=2 Tax=Harenicola maris TaxID=2841044 RepID=A0AAP2CLC0_9RHOB|nr:tRNA lysidine(34) synthetase TilS [Harenicola maris]